MRFHVPFLVCLAALPFEAAGAPRLDPQTQKQLEALGYVGP